MTDNFYQNNIAALRDCRLPVGNPPRVGNSLAGRPSPFRGVLDEAGDRPSAGDGITAQTGASGEVTVKVGDLLIHSRYDPRKEARVFARDVPPDSRVCLYGFGLGYHIEALLEQVGPKGFVLAIELNPDLLAAAMRLRDLRPVLTDPRFHLIFGDEESAVAAEISRCMIEMIQSGEGQDLEVKLHSPSFQCLPPGFEKIANALEILLMERRAPAILGGLENENYLLNKEIVGQSQGILGMRDTHQGQPAILASAGPSLDDILPYLKKMASDVVLACVDTALPVLSREGIVPQYVFSLDPQEESFLHFVENLDSPVKLVYTPTANTRIVHSYKGEKIVVFKEGHSLFKTPSKLMREKGTTRSGSSVSCLGLDCLIQMGCNPVILTGQDCAFSGNRTYSRHSDINTHLLDRLHNHSTLELSHLETAQINKQVSVDSASGENTATNQMLYRYRRDLEEIAQSHPETKIYNLCSHGARIQNMIPLGSVNELTKILTT